MLCLSAALSVSLGGFRVVARIIFGSSSLLSLFMRL